MRIETELKYDFDDVLIRPKRSTLESRKEVDLHRSYKFKHGGTYFGIPIMAANMDGVGTIDVSRELSDIGLFTCFRKSTPINFIIKELLSERSNNTAVTIGKNLVDFNKLKELKEELIKEGHILKYVCVDVANGYSQSFVDYIKQVREILPHSTIIAGNVVTGEMVEELLLAGADIIKVGIGSGSVCTTRIKTGVGYPQFSCIAECADAAHGLNGHIVADGGCTSPGDVAKAFGAGADFVMLGSMLAGCKEGGGKIIEKEGKQYVEFYGMSSKVANEKHNGGLKDYRTSEGRRVLLPYRGLIKDVVQDILGGVRSTCTYVGANQLRHLSKCATFIRCTNTHSKIYEANTIEI